MPLTTQRLLVRALLHRRGRTAAALAGLTLCAAIVTAITALYADLGEKLNGSFAAFGPNVVLTTRDGAPLPEDIQGRIRQATGIRVDTVTEGVIIAEAGGSHVAVVGANLDDLLQMHRSWSCVRGRADATNAAVFGRRVDEALQKPSTLTLQFQGTPLTVSVNTVCASGGIEDSQIYISQAAFAGWTHAPFTVVEARIPGSAEQANAAVSRLRAALPELNVQPVRELLQGQAHVVERTRSFMFAAAGIVIATLAIAVLATLSAMVLDRRRDYAVMKALGCPERRLHWLFLLETAVLSLSGVALGLGLGLLAALLVGEINFHTRIALHWRVFPLALLANLAVAAIASAWPLRALSAVEPAALLRGE